MGHGRDVRKAREEEKYIPPNVYFPYRGCESHAVSYDSPHDVHRISTLSWDDHHEIEDDDQSDSEY